MPGKSKHGRGKHPHHIKKIRAREQRGAQVSQAPSISGVSQVAAKSISAPANISISPTKSGAMVYPFITKELRNIGILTVIILVILIVLSRVF